MYKFTVKNVKVHVPFGEERFLSATNIAITTYIYGCVIERVIDLPIVKCWAKRHKLEY